MSNDTAITLGYLFMYGSLPWTVTITTLAVRREWPSPRYTRWMIPSFVGITLGFVFLILGFA